MERRHFLKLSSLAATPLLLRGIPVAGANVLGDEILDSMARYADTCGKKLVIIQMPGGNDGLNTVFPLDQWDNLQAARSNIIMQENQVLSLDNNITTGLHPAMTGMRNLYNEGKLMIVQGVTYPNPSLSHFRSTDIWLSGSESSVALDTGWMGRALDTMFPGYPGLYPNADMPHPLAVQIGSALPFALQGPSINMGYNTSDPNDLLNVINSITDPAPNNDYGNELTFIRLMKDQSNVYAQSIQDAYAASSTLATYPADNRLADQLQIVARLIAGGLETPVYIVKHPNSFDTHEFQVDSSDRTQGPHADMLKLLSDAVLAFQQDIELMGQGPNVTGMTFSEFGRRITSNASFGTDHGTGAPVFFFGAALNTGSDTDHPVAGMLGDSPVIPQNATVFDQVAMQYDYRQVYATVMQNWLCMPQPEVEEVLGGSFARISLFENTTVLPVELLYFRGNAEGEASVLEWSTATELNNYKFEVERSTDAINFSKIGQRMGAGTTNVPQRYGFTDQAPYQGINYYRLRQIDYDGTEEFSNIISIYFDAVSSISVFPNPARHEIIVQVVDNRKDCYVQIYNAFGQLVMEQPLLQGTDRLTLNISALPKGSYFARIIADKVLLTQQFVKQ
jgi:uncharacterized protein (DUF1501 family)